MKTIRFKGWFTKEWFKTLAGILFLILFFCFWGFIVSFLFLQYFFAPFYSNETFTKFLFYLTVGLVGGVVFCPFIVALKREHKDKKIIGIFNFLLGVVCLPPFLKTLLTIGFKITINVFGWKVMVWVSLLTWALWPGCETRRTKTKHPGLIQDNEKVA